MIGNVLILTVGLPYSGKSTWAAKTGFPVVSPDSFRLAITGKRFHAPAEPVVWAAVRIAVNALFLSGHEVVVLDACNITRERREEWAPKEAAPGVAYWTPVIRPFSTSRAECLRRSAEAGDLEIASVINRMADAADDPLEDGLGVWDLPLVVDQ